MTESIEFINQNYLQAICDFLNFKGLKEAYVIAIHIVI